ncbi:MAG: lipocalin family protein [Bacteroidaceae bacterium]|nr:lipocalin family protein [Bacteroidaceae bacterium]
MKTTLITSILVGLCGVASARQIDNSTITAFDLDRYLGKWYEVARYDHAFERGLVGTTAEYTRRGDGKIKVLNSGYLDTLDGSYQQSVGKAKPNSNGKPGQLRVSFFGPFYGDYYILDLAPDYSYSVVGSSSPRYLWILSRTPHLSPEVKTRIVDNLQRRGYDTDKLIWVEQ